MDTMTHPPTYLFPLSLPQITPITYLLHPPFPLRIPYLPDNNFPQKYLRCQTHFFWILKTSLLPQLKYTFTFRRFNPSTLIQLLLLTSIVLRPRV